MSRANLPLLPTGVAFEVLPQHRAMVRLQPAFPREWLAGASAWEDGAEMLHLAWELARCAPDAGAADARALMLLAFAALAGLRQGSTRVPVRGALAAGGLAPILGPLGAGDADRAALARILDAPPEAVRPVLGAPGDFTPLLLDGDWLWTQRVRAVEERLAARVAARMDAQPLCADAAADAALSSVLSRPAVRNGQPIALSSEQRAAVHLALLRPLSVVAGGPGTGKTSIVAYLVRALARLGVAPVEIALAAPTGKAAARMDQALREQLRTIDGTDALDGAVLAQLPPAQTLHRLLGYSPSRDAFAHHAANPLSHAAVIVDESSMVDLQLMERLASAVRPDARLVLLGDAEQLPSVEAGAVFRDLLPAPGQPDDRRTRAAVRLTRSYRMDPADPAGRNVLTVARAVRDGALPPMQSGGALGEATVRVRARAEELAWEGVEHLACAVGDEVERAFLERWRAARCPAEVAPLRRRAYRFDSGVAEPGEQPLLGQLFAEAERARLLCATRGRDLGGVAGVNAYLHQLELDAWRARGERLASDSAMLPGEPVVVERNDYARGLFNGDAGLVVRGRESTGAGMRWLAVFRAGAGFRAFPLEALRGALELAHAMTVHKAQGAEVEQVALLLPGRELPLLGRELLYTAITRARRAAVLVGEARVLAAAVGRALPRHSGMRERLAGAASSSEETGT